MGAVSHLFCEITDEDKFHRLKVGEMVFRIDPDYFRPTEVETLLGNPTKANEKNGLSPEITAQEMYQETSQEMIAYDLIQARQHALLKANGFKVNVSIR